MKNDLSRSFAALLLTVIAAWTAVAAANVPPHEVEPPEHARAREWFGPWTGLRAWQDRVQKDLEAGRPIPPARFDELFDDAFFGTRADPFALIEGFDEHFRPLLDGRDRASFGRSWEDWRRDRMGLGAVKTRVEEAHDGVVLVFDIPGLDAASVKLDISRAGVRVSYDARKVAQKIDAHGRVVSRSVSSARFEKIVPVPPGADPERYRVEKKGESVRLIFERLNSGMKT